MTATERSKPPQLPVPVAEILYVSLEHILDLAEGGREIPKTLTDNMRLVMKTYSKYRTDVLVKRGNDAVDARRYTDIARQSLHRWLTMRASKHIELQADFDRWAEELSDDG